jgi:hypothetical protein
MRSTFTAPWYGMKLTITSQGQCKVEFNYEPECKKGISSNLVSGQFPSCYHAHGAGGVSELLCRPGISHGAAGGAASASSAP